MTKAIVTLIIIFQTPIILFSQHLSELRIYSSEAVMIADSFGVKMEVDSINWETWCNLISKNQVRNQSNLDSVFYYLQQEISSRQNDFTKTLYWMNVADNVHLDERINLYKNEFVKMSRSLLFNIKNDNRIELDRLFEVLGYLDLPNEFRDSLVNFENVPLKVLARIESEKFQDSLIKQVLTEYLDTIEYDIPTNSRIGDLLYVGSDSCFMTISKLLSSKHLVFILKQEKTTSNCNLWRINSINNYILNDFFNYFKFDIGEYLKLISYGQIEVFGYQNYMNSGNETEFERIKKIGVEIYATIIQQYISKKLNYQVNLKYPGNHFYCDNRLEPPMNKLDDYDFSCLIESNLGSDICDKFPKECENAKKTLKKSFRNFYKSLGQ